MADVITRFKLETTQYDSKLRDASKGLQAYGKQIETAGKDFTNFSQKAVEAARSLGTIASGANNTKDKLKDLVGAYNDVAKTYNKLTEQQRQTDFGKAMSKSLEQLQVRIKETKQELYGLGDATKNAGGGLFGGGKLDGMLQVFGGNVMTKVAGIALGAVTSLTSEIEDAVKQGIELAKQGEGVRIAFERLNKPGLLDNLREATHGTVTNLELMKAAVKFNDFKLPVEELGTMLAFAQQKAKDTGQSIDYMVDSIVTGLGRKSLMILDNLGLSAAEIKEKMKETGDMTKAVGEIIREQMSKAGDYVETAADRATKADVELKNAMEDLGRVMQPLTEESNNLWNSIKVGAINALTPVMELIARMTDAGKLRNQLGNLNAPTGGMNSAVDAQLQKLRIAKSAGGSNNYVNSTYQGQIEEYNRTINAADKYVKQFESNRSKINTILQEASKEFGQKFGSMADLKAYQGAFKKMRDEYKQGAKEIMAPVKVDVKTSEAETNIESLKKKLADLEAQRKKAIKAGDTEKSKSLLKEINQTKADIRGLDPTALKTTTRKTETVYIEGSIAAQSKIVSDLTKKWNEAGEDMRTGYLYQLIEAEKKLKSIKDEQQALKDLRTGDIKGATPVGLGDNTSKMKTLKELQGVKLELKLPKEKTEASFTKEVGNMASGISQMVGGIEALGIELPEGIKSAVEGISSLITIVSGIATIVTAIEALTAADTIIPFARGGIVPKFAGGGLIGKAAGGMLIPGNSFSGDNLRLPVDGGRGVIGVNSGELILSKAQQSTLASELQNGGNRIQVVGRLSGEQLFLCAENWAKRTGKGEFVTW